MSGVGKLAFLGAGKMNGAILGGLMHAGWDPASVGIVEHSEPRRDELVAQYGVTAMTLDDAAGWADTFMVGVKPHDVAGVVDQLAARIRPGAVVISIAAGVTTEALESRLPKGQPVVRTIPNTPALVGQGMAGITAGSSATNDDVARAQAILGAVGRSVVVPERLQDAVSALAGSGPAYVFMVCEALVDAAVTLGIPRPQARELAVQTIVGAGALLATGEHPAILRENVTSPGGTTAAAVGKLEAHGLRAAFLDALTAAVARSREVAD